jgi:hypothetical protein
MNVTPNTLEGMQGFAVLYLSLKILNIRQNQAHDITYFTVTHHQVLVL